MGSIEPRPLDDEGLPRPPPVRGKLSRWLVRAMVHAESVMFLAIAVALLVIAVVVFVRGVHNLVLAPPHEQFVVTITKLGCSVPAPGRCRFRPAAGRG